MYTSLVAGFDTLMGEPAGGSLAGLLTCLLILFAAFIGLCVVGAAGVGLYPQLQKMFNGVFKGLADEDKPDGDK
jgi:hypothetical protein